MESTHSNYKANSIFGKNEPLNRRATYEINIDGISQAVNSKITEICRIIVPNGYKYNKEYAYAIDRITGEVLSYEEGDAGECMSKRFFDQIGDKPADSVLLIHNHTDNKNASMMDVNTFMTDIRVYASIMACNNGDMHYMSGKKVILQAYLIFSCMSETEKDMLLKDLPEFREICENTDRKQAKQEELWAQEFIKKYVKRYQ